MKWLSNGSWCYIDQKIKNNAHLEEVLCTYNVVNKYIYTWSSIPPCNILTGPLLILDVLKIEKKTWKLRVEEQYSI